MMQYDVVDMLSNHPLWEKFMGNNGTEHQMLLEKYKLYSFEGN